MLSLAQFCTAHFVNIPFLHSCHCAKIQVSFSFQVYGVISLLFVITSILGFCLETLPSLKPAIEIIGGNSSNSTNLCDGDSKDEMIQSMKPNKGLNILDFICTIYFSIELVVRFTFAPKKLSFIKSMMNIIDLLALVPLYVQLVFNTHNLSLCYANEKLVVEIMFLLRIIRMFRIFHLVKHYQALKILIYALKASVQELLMLAIFLLIGMLVFASLIYYAERKDAVNASDMFTTIPVGFWWAIITMTTVGYGDVYPETPFGYVVGVMCAVSGVLMIALTIPVISMNFTLFYTHVRSRAEKPKTFHVGMSRQTMVSHSDEGFETTIVEEEEGGRKHSNGSVVTDTYMNGSAVLRSLSKTRYPKYSPFGKIQEVNSLSNIEIGKSSPELKRTNSDRAHSDDGVTYSGETIL